jgi:hypothetical protein
MKMYRYSIDITILYLSKNNIRNYLYVGIKGEDNPINGLDIIDIKEDFSLQILPERPMH